MLGRGAEGRLQFFERVAGRGGQRKRKRERELKNEQARNCVREREKEEICG